SPFTLNPDGSVSHSGPVSLYGPLDVHGAITSDQKLTVPAITLSGGGHISSDVDGNMVLDGPVTATGNVNLGNNSLTGGSATFDGKVTMSTLTLDDGLGGVELSALGGFLFTDAAISTSSSISASSAQFGGKVRADTFTINDGAEGVELNAVDGVIFTTGG